MHRMLLAVAVALLAVSTLATAQDRPTGTGAGTGSQDRTGAASASDPMAGWTPRMVKNEQADRKEIQALIAAMDAAAMKGDLEAAVELVDFPVLMVTDDKKGEVTSESWERDRWVQVMEPFYKPNPSMKWTNKPTIFVVTDSLATVNNVVTMTMGKQKMTSRNSMILVRADGKWKVKSMMEGGWGDMMASSQEGGTAGTGAGSQAPAGTTTGAEEPSSPATGSQAPSSSGTSTPTPGTK